MKLTREYYIPANSTEVKDPDSEAIAYTFTDRKGRPCASGFGGQRSKPDWCFAFRSEEHRAKHIKEYFAIQQGRDADKEQRAAKRNATVTALQVGDILYYSWGYDQTNAQFYQVVEVKPSGKSVMIREIAQEQTTTGFMCGQAMPIKDKFRGEAFLKRAAEDSVRMDYSSARKWDGRPVYVSWYA